MFQVGKKKAFFFSKFNTISDPRDLRISTESKHRKQEENYTKAHDSQAFQSQ